MRSLFRTLTVAILGLTLTAGSARASQVVFGNLGSDGSGGLLTQNTPITSTQWLAIGFSTGAGSTNLFVDNIVLGLIANPGAGSVSTSVSIWTESSSQPGSLLYTSTPALAVSDATESKYSFSFGGASLLAGSNYWVVLQQPNVRWNYSDAFSTPSGQNSSGYTYTSAKLTTNAGGSWSSSAPGGISAISITASSTGPAPIPEPGTWAAAALLIGAAAYVRLRRRAQAA